MSVEWVGLGSEIDDRE
jgi:hypothetical protein